MRKNLTKTGVVTMLMVMIVAASSIAMACNVDTTNAVKETPNMTTRTSVMHDLVTD